MGKELEINDFLKDFITNYIGRLSMPKSFNYSDLIVQNHNQNSITFQYEIDIAFHTKVNIEFKVTSDLENEYQIQVEMNTKSYYYEVSTTKNIIIKDDKVTENAFAISDSEKNFKLTGIQDKDNIKAEVSYKDGSSNNINGTLTHDIDNHLYIFKMTDEHTKGVKLVYDYSMYDDYGLPFSPEVLIITSLTNIAILNSKLQPYKYLRELRGAFPTICYYDDNIPDMNAFFNPKRMEFGGYDFVINNTGYHIINNGEKYNVTSPLIMQDNKIMANPINNRLFDEITLDDNDNIRAVYDLSSNVVNTDTLLTTIKDKVKSFSEERPNHNSTEIIEIMVNDLSQILELDFYEMKKYFYKDSNPVLPKVTLIGGTLADILKCDMHLLSRIESILAQDLFDIEKIKEAYLSYLKELRYVLEQNTIDYPKIYRRYM